MEKIAVTNTHAYYNTVTITAVKGFIVEAPNLTDSSTFWVERETL